MNFSIDREKRSFYNFIATVSDENGLFSNVNVKLEILDVNDNPPKFSRSGKFSKFSTVFKHLEFVSPNFSLRMKKVISGTISEGNHFDFGNVVISDADSSTSHPMEITSNLLIANYIGEETYRIILKEPIKLEKDAKCSENGNFVDFTDTLTVSDMPSNHTVLPFDSSLFKTSIPVILAVVDSNNHYPQIFINSTSFTLPENAKIGHELAQFYLTDDDPCTTDDDLRLSLEKSENSIYFTVAENKLFLAREIDFEKLANETFEIEVSVTDGASALDSKKTKLALTIIILNIDDEQIIINDINIKKEIMENQLIDTSIGNLRQKLQQ